MSKAKTILFYVMLTLLGCADSEVVSECEQADGGQQDRTWYRDCDGDGFASQKHGLVQGCSPPNAEPGCAAWTELEPVPGAVDCDDFDSAYKPGAGFGPAGNGDGDLNCDGVVTLETVVHGLPNSVGEGDYPLCTSSACAPMCAEPANGWEAKFSCSVSATSRVQMWIKQQDEINGGCFRWTSEPDREQVLGLQFCR